MSERLEFYRKNRAPKRSFIHPTAVVHPWVELGKNVVIHEYCTLGTEGFGYIWDPEEKEWIHVEHRGKVIIGDDVEIYAHTNVDRATKDETIVGRGTKIDHYCHVGHNSITGEDNIITACVFIGGGAKIGNRVWVGPNTTIQEKVTVGDDVFIGSQANVIKDCEPGWLYVGNPAKKLRENKRLE